MRSFTTMLASASLFAATTLATAAPGANWGGNWGPWKQSVNNIGRDTCMSDEDAQTVANNFEALITNYSDALANATLTEDFHDYTDSVIELIDNGCANSPVPLGSAAFGTRAAFEQGQGSQPSIPFTQLNVWHECLSVTMRWRSEQSPSSVTGILVLETVYQNNAWLIQTVYSEFNSGAWLVNLGTFHPQHCNA